MALGNDNNDRGDLIVLDLKTRDENLQNIDPVFVIRKKIDSKWENTGTCKKFTGRLKRVFTKVQEYKKDGKLISSKPKADLYFEDGNETYLLSLGYKISTRGLFNRLLNLTSFSNLEVNCWRDDKGYDVVTLRQNGQSVKGKFSRDEIPAPEEFKRKGIVERDYEKVDLFFKEKLDELNEKVKTTKAEKVEKVEKYIEDDYLDGQKGSVGVVEEEDNIPF
jgi:hypothetical protein